MICQPYYCISGHLATAINRAENDHDGLIFSLLRGLARRGKFSGKCVFLSKRWNKKIAACGYFYSHHANTLTIWTYPGGTVTDPPLVFLKTGITYLKTTGTTPAERFFFLAAMALVFTQFSFTIPDFS